MNYVNYLNLFYFLSPALVSLSLSLSLETKDFQFSACFSIRERALYVVPNELGFGETLRPRTFGCDAISSYNYNALMHNKVLWLPAKWGH